MLLSVLAQIHRSADTFTNVKLMVNTGEKAEEEDAVLRFDDGSLVIYGKGRTVLKSFTYAEIKGAEYLVLRRAHAGSPALAWRSPSVSSRCRCSS